MEKFLPINLEEENFLQTLLLLQSEFEKSYGKTSITKKDVPVDQIGQTISEFIDLVKVSLDSEFKNYVLKRLISLKSTSQILIEIQKYLPISFRDLRMDATNLSIETNPNTTFYTPRVLNLVIEKMSIDSISHNFLDIIEIAFNNLLYFLKYRLTIEEMIYNISLDLKNTLSKKACIPFKRLLIEEEYYKNYIIP